MKKVVKILIGIVLLLLVALISIPFLFQDKIVTLIKETVNENVNAKVDFSDASLSLLRNFPKASLKLENVAVTNFEPFKGDTLFYAKDINLKLKLTDLFKVKEGELNVSSFIIDNALVNVMVDKNGKANYDIAKESDSSKDESSTNESSAFKLSVNEYAIKNSAIKYTDQQSEMIALLSEFNHSGKGDFSEDNVELDTQTNTNISFTMVESNYVDHQHLDLDAILAMDLKNSKFSFLDNEAHINHLPLIFNGFVQLHEKTQEIHLDFKTPSADFKNFLALIPDEYAKDIADVKTTGNYSLTGKVDGIISEKTIPKLDIAIKSNNASFHYPDLPKGVENISIDTEIKNNTGILENTYVNLNKLHFKIDNNEFDGKATIKNLTTNPVINTTINGTLDLADITKVYPIETAKELSGVVTADLTASFDMDAVTKHKHERIKNNGTIELNNFVFDGDDIAHPLAINAAKVDFKTERISLTKFDAKTGDSDLNATGTIDNLLEFLLADGNLEGNFNLNSNVFKLSDFMTEATETTSKEGESSSETTTGEETLKIPAFLDCTISANAKEVYYDNLKLENVKGTLILKDEKATLKDVNGNMFDGSIALNGTVNTQDEKTVFDMDLGIDSFDISQSFQNIEMFKMLSPIGSIFKGKINTDVNLSGSLKDDLSPNLNSITGKALAELLTTNIDPEESAALSLLNNKLDFIDLKKLDLKDLKTKIAFENGKVNVAPIDLKYKDIDISLAGTHSIEQVMDYKATFNVPAKYLGKEVTALLSKLDASNQDMLVPVTANLSGAFTSPTVNTDLKSAVGNLTTQLVQQQKTKLINKGVNSILGNVSKDSTNTTKSTVSNALGGLLNKKKDTATSTTETTDTKSEVKEKAVEKAADVLGGLFGKKK